MTKKHVFLSIFILTGMLLSAQSPLWMRYPSISPDGRQVAFAYKGDIFKVSYTPGGARPLPYIPLILQYPPEYNPSS